MNMRMDCSHVHWVNHEQLLSVSSPPNDHSCRRKRPKPKQSPASSLSLPPPRPALQSLLPRHHLLRTTMQPQPPHTVPRLRSPIGQRPHPTMNGPTWRGSLDNVEDERSAKNTVRHKRRRRTGTISTIPAGPTTTRSTRSVKRRFARSAIGKICCTGTA